MMVAALSVTALLAAAPVDVTTFTLANGLSVVVHRDASLPRVYVELAYLVGAAHEREGASGFAHLFEHLMFEGSKNVPEGAFDTWLEAAGGDNNAWTGYDRTTYHETVPKSALELALFLEADRMGNLLDGMSDDVVDGQREVVRNERRERSEVQPYAKVELFLPGALYPPGHPYHRPVIGSHLDLARASADDVRAFFREHYRPANAHLIIAGDVAPQEARRLVEKHFGPLPASPREPPPAPAPAPLTKEQRLVTEDDVELPKLVLAWPAVPLFAEHDAALDMLADILADGRTARLRKRLVDELGLARSVTAWNVSRTRAGQFEIEVLAKPGVSLDEVLAAVDGEVSRLAREGPTEEELVLALRSWEVEFLDDMERLGSRASRMQSYAIHLGRPDAFDEDRARFLALTPLTLREAAARFLGPGRVVVSVVPRGAAALAVTGSLPAPEDPPPPPSHDVKEPSPRPPPAVSPPAPGDPPRLVLPKEDRFTLGPAKVPVSLVQRAGTGLVDLRLSFAGGGELDPLGQEGLVHLAAEMLTRGAGALDAPGFEAALKRLGASVDAWADWDSVEVSLHVPAARAAEAVALLAQALFSPRLDEEEWRKLLEEERADLLRARASAGTLLDLARPWAVYGASDRRGVRLRGTSTTLARITRADVASRWSALLSGERVRAVVAGDVAAAEAEALLRPLSVWPKAPPLSRVERRGPSGQGGVVLVDRPGSVQSALSVTGPLVEPVSIVDAPVTVMRTLLGGSFASRLNQNLREEHQYGYGASAFLVHTPQAAYLGVRTQVARDVTGAAVLEIAGELARIQIPAEPDEVERARSYAMLTLPDSLETGRDVVAHLAWLASQGSDLEAWGALQGALPVVDVGQTARAARAVLHGKGGAIAIVGDPGPVEAQLQAAGLGPVFRLDADVLLGPPP